MTCPNLLNRTAFLTTIAYAEGTAGPDGYRMLFGGSLFTDFSDHPRKVITLPSGNRTISSSAAGRYQILKRTWDDVRRVIDLPDFTPASQDLAAIELIRRRGALALVDAGKFAEAVDKCKKEWASLPGAGYGQPEKKLADLSKVFQDAGGILA